MALPEYVKRAKNNYNSRHELIQLRLPVGSKDRIKAIIGDNGSMAAFCVDAILETIDGYEAAERLIDEEPQGTASERAGEQEKEVCNGTANEPAESQEKHPERRDNAVTIADLQAQLDLKRQEQEERKQKQEQERKERQEAEREEKRAEMRGIVEKIRNGAKENREKMGIVQVALENQEVLSIILSPEGKEEFISKYGQEAYDEIVKADKERRREETKRRERMENLASDQDQKPGFMEGLE